MTTTEQKDARRLALAKVVLVNEPATTGVLHAVGLIESVMPRPGTPEYRDAFAWAHAQREKHAATR
jgi:hypothetical protein